MTFYGTVAPSLCHSREHSRFVSANAFGKSRISGQEDASPFADDVVRLNTIGTNEAASFQLRRQLRSIRIIAVDS